MSRMPGDRRKRVLILAPFFGAPGAWIDDFCDRPDFEFRKAPLLYQPRSWHARGGRTPPGEWLHYTRYAYEALKWKSDCVVTCFPQLALVAAALLPFRAGRNTRLIAWNFNLGSVSGRLKGRVAGRILRRVDRFVVHAREEIVRYAQWLAISQDRFHFVPLQKGRVANVKPSPIPGPYVVSMGSANRDYETLLEALRDTGIKTVIISKKGIVDSLPDHPDVLKLHGLAQEECDSILAGARLNVVPIAPTQTASGQVTLVTSMRMGIATIATRCLSTLDYVRDGETALLAEPGDARALRAAIQSLWQDDELRSRIGHAACKHAAEYFSDEAAGRHLAEVIDEVLADDCTAENK